MKAFILVAILGLTIQGDLAATEANMDVGCGGYVSPVFPLVADKDYARTCWIARVEKDTMTDATSCVIYPAGMKSKSYPFAFISKSGVQLSVAGTDRYPGTGTMIRVDEHTAITGGESFGKGSIALLLQQMSQGSVVRTRLSEWPSNTYQDGVFDAHGFSEAVDYCRTATR